MKIIKASAPGKVFFTGEHAVVHDKLGLATAIGLRTSCEIKEIGTDTPLLKNIGPMIRLREVELNQIFEAVEKAVEEKNFLVFKEMLANDKNVCVKYLIGYMMNKHRINFDSVQIINSSELRKGMSGSASIFSSVVHALSEYYGVNLGKKEISDIAYRGDIIAHGGTPSGIDNSTTTFGGYVKFRKSVGVKQLDIRNKYHIVIGDTLKPASTAEMVTLVREKVNANDKAVLSALSSIDSISQEAVDILKLGDLKTLGKLMDNNQEQLRILGVSSSELENLISVAKRAGALGAKLSGGGGGGCMVALCEDAMDQKKVAEAIKAAGGEPFITDIGAEGVRIEANE